MKTRLALEREVLKALPTGYTYSEEDALALVQKEIPDFTKAELDALRDRGAIDWIYINGKTTYSRTFYDTLLGVTRISPHVQASRRRTKVIAWNFCAKMYAT